MYNHLSSIQCRLILWFCIALVVGQEKTHGQTLKVGEHPNHFVILIDASESVVSSSTRTAYHKALTEILIKRLYEDGFGATIPPFDPNQDVLTLHHFGIVPIDSPIPYYAHLSEYDLLTDFIHPSFIRARHVSLDTLRGKLIPDQYYGLTALSWAKHMGLNASRATTLNELSQRTFLIVVHDGKFNENLLAEEVRTIRRWSNPRNYAEAEKILDHIGNKYNFTESERQEKVHSDDQADAIFIEAFQVKLLSQMAWEGSATKIEPFDEIQLRWTGGSENESEGIIKAKLSSALLHWLSELQNPVGTLSLEGQVNTSPSAWDMKEAQTQPVAIPTAISCNPEQATALLNVVGAQSDELLGTRAVSYTYDHRLVGEVPARCTIEYWAAILAVALAMTAGLAALIYFLIFRFIKTHLEIKLPGSSVPIRIKRSNSVPRQSSIVPRLNVPILTLRLPNKWVQRLFYNDARLVVEGVSGYWDYSGADTLVLPVPYRHVRALWREIPQTHAKLTLNFHHGNQQATAYISYQPSSLDQLKDSNEENLI